MIGASVVPVAMSVVVAAGADRQHGDTRRGRGRGRLSVRRELGRRCSSCREMPPTPRSATRASTRRGARLATWTRPGSTSDTSSPPSRVARIVLARPQMANAQDYQMLSELNAAFDRADARRLGARDHPRRRRQPLLVRARPAGRHRHERASTRSARGAASAPRRRGLHGDRSRDVRRSLLAMAEHPQADDRPGAGQGDRRRADAGLADGSRRVLGRRDLRRSGRRLRCERARVLRARLRGGCPPGQGDAVHRPSDHRPGGVSTRDGQPRRGPCRSRAGDARLGRAHRPPAELRPDARQAERQQQPRRDGFLHRDPGRVRLHHVAHNHNLRLYDSLVDPAGLQVVRGES